jgi:hypothetical protein
VLEADGVQRYTTDTPQAGAAHSDHSHTGYAGEAELETTTSLLNWDGCFMHAWSRYFETRICMPGIGGVQLTIPKSSESEGNRERVSFARQIAGYIT